MTDVLTADDSLYEELYDVRREATELGNFVEEDMNPPMCALRDKAPVQKGFLRDLLGLPPHFRQGAVADLEGYTCFTFDTCNEAFRDPERFSNNTYHVDPTEERTFGILEMDPPLHRPYRAALQPMFIKPRALTWWRQRFINEIVDALVTNLNGRDRAELNLQLCARVPVHTVTRAMGLEGDDALRFRTALVTSGARIGVTPEMRSEATQTVQHMLSDLIARRRREPGDDIISGLIAAELDLPNGERRPLTDGEIFTEARLVLIAGGGTSWRQFGITLWALLTNPDQFEAVKADRGLIDDAIEESVRWNPTDPVFVRLIMSDTELAGFPLPANSALEICLGAANRDPSRWDDPDVYDLHRPRQVHLGFGIGSHQCLGMNVARSQVNVGINALLDHFPNLRLDPDAPPPYLTGGLEQRGISALPVRLK